MGCGGVDGGVEVAAVGVGVDLAGVGLLDAVEAHGHGVDGGTEAGEVLTHVAVLHGGLVGAVEFGVEADEDLARLERFFLIRHCAALGGFALIAEVLEHASVKEVEDEELLIGGDFQPSGVGHDDLRVVESVGVVVDHQVVQQAVVVFLLDVHVEA